ncbi:MAG: TetR/AcrR family transcriptional regulator, partial [Chitinispirillia bacterium]
IQEFLETARKEKEITSFPFDGFLTDFLCEYILGVVLYWLADDSEEFSNTTQMVDLTLNLGNAIMTCGIIDKGMEIVNFFIKSHILRFMSGNENIISQLKKFKKIYR